MVSDIAESPEYVAVMASVLRMRLILPAVFVALPFTAACAPLPLPHASPLAPSAAPHSAEMPYAAINTKRVVYFPEARTRGSFEVLRGCVIYRRAGDGFLFTPVFPVGSKIIREGSAYYLEINGKRHRFGQEFILGGGVASLSESAEISLSRSPPPSCPSPIWLVSQVEER